MDEQRSEPFPEKPTAQEEVALRELASRLLAPPDPYDETTAPPRILVGRLPEDLPIEVPIPGGATVVGSVVRNLPRGGQSTEIVLDAVSSVERFREDYRRLLLTSGWSEDEEGPERPGRSGFVPQDMPMLFRSAYRFPRLRRRLGLDRPELPPIFRLGARGPKLLLTVRDRRNASTDVRLDLITSQRDPWVEHDPAWTVIPSLYSPPDVRKRSEVERTGVLAPPFGTRQLGGDWGGGGSHRENDGAYSYVALETDSDLATLAAHYAAQLEEAEWFRTDGGQSGPQAWSTWTFADGQGRPWTGAFTVLRLPEAPEGTPNRYLLQVHAGRTSNR